MTKLLVRPKLPRGVYMYGGVGRGKSFLMDCFFQAVPLTRKTRLHFHEFMREVHRELQDLKGIRRPAGGAGQAHRQAIPPDLFRRVPRGSDVTDAMILLPAAGRDVQATASPSSRHRISNPTSLYPNGLHRDRILPAIALLNEKLEVINVDHGTDYRQPLA